MTSNEAFNAALAYGASHPWEAGQIKRSFVQCAQCSWAAQSACVTSQQLKAVLGCMGFSVETIT
jgi:hypothetical protein